MTVPAAPNTFGLRFIGVDVATQPKSVGLALCTYCSGELRLEQICSHRTWTAIDDQLATWLRLPPRIASPTAIGSVEGAPSDNPPHRPSPAHSPTLLALDAPLGWPAQLADTLLKHRAGDPVPGVANELFRRRTDDVVAAKLGKRPLDVGADRIARTAHTALSLLGRLRGAHSLRIPLAWTPGEISSTRAIEVYPAGTLASRALPSSGYKGSSEAATSIRRDILHGLGSELEYTDHASALMSSSDHLLDAVLCCIAARDFADARVIQPSCHDPASKEGWIWVAPRAGTALQQTPR